MTHRTWISIRVCALTTRLAVDYLDRFDYIRSILKITGLIPSVQHEIVTPFSLK